MTRGARFATAALAAGVLTFSLAAGLSGAASRAPSLRLVARQPLKLAGQGFAPRERVRVVASWESGKATRATRATAAGDFLVRFRGVRPGRCEALVVRAIGSRGGYAVLELPQPACLPA